MSGSGGTGGSGAIDGSVRPQLPRGVRLRQDPVRGGWSLLGPERVFELDDIALEILRRCDGVRDLAAIEADLAAAFDAEPAEVADDVRQFLRDMADKGMVQL